MPDKNRHKIDEAQRKEQRQREAAMDERDEDHPSTNGRTKAPVAPNPEDKQ